MFGVICYYYCVTLRFDCIKFDNVEKQYTKKQIMNIIKNNDINDFIEIFIQEINCNFGIMQFEYWLDDTFELKFFIEVSEPSKTQLKNAFKNISLEDTVYNSRPDNLWIVKQLIKPNEEYGLIDYRHNPIKIGLIDSKLYESIINENSYKNILSDYNKENIYKATIENLKKNF